MRPLYQTVHFSSDNKTHSHFFARKNSFVTLISMLFLPTRSLHLALSHSTEKSMFLSSQNNLPKITYLSKITYTSFSYKTSSFFPKLIIKKISLSNLSQHNNINNSPQIIKDHNSPLMTHFLQNSSNQQQFNHNFTNSNTQGIIYHQQHNITSIKA